MVRVRSLFVVVVLLLLGTAGQVAADLPAHAYGRTTHPQWMAWVPDDTLLSRLSLPGTHDSMADDVDNDLAEIGAKWIETQDLDLQAQLESGIRAFDMRCQVGGPDDNPHLGLFHASFFLGHFFGSGVLDVCAEFLRAFPTETLLMRVKEEDDDEGARFGDVFRDVYFNNPAWAALFWRPDPGRPGRIPSLGEVRGKIVVLPDFADSVGTAFGLPWSGLAIQDYFKVSKNSELDVKWSRVVEQFDRADVDPDDCRLYVNFLSATSVDGNSPFQDPPTPRDVATGYGYLAPVFGVRGINLRALEFLFAGAQERRRLGLIMMDFPGADLIDAIVAHNFALAQHPFAVRDDFAVCVDHLARTASWAQQEGFNTTRYGEDEDSCEGRSLRMLDFFQHVLPCARVGAHCVHDQSSAGWFFHVAEQVALRNGQQRPAALSTATADDYAFVVWAYEQREGVVPTPVLPQPIDTIVADAVRGLTPLPNAGFLGQQLIRNLNARGIANASWGAIVKRSPFGFSNWSYQLPGTLASSHERTLGGFGFRFIVWVVDAASGAGQPPPPTVSCSVRRSVLWPPRGALLPIRLSVAADGAGSTLRLRVRILCSEPSLTVGWGPDAIGTSPASTRLRAVRSATAGGRIYIVLAEAEDACGRVVRSACPVLVPRAPAVTTILRLRSAAAEAGREAERGCVPQGYTLVHAYEWAE